MKNLFILTSVFLGSSLLATDVHTGKRIAINKRFSGTPSKGPVGAISIIIDKSDYELNVYDDKGWYATYPVVFGNSSLADKKMEGDKNTPEGTYRITAKRVHENGAAFFLLITPPLQTVQNLISVSNGAKFLPMPVLVAV